MGRLCNIYDLNFQMPVGHKAEMISDIYARCRLQSVIDADHIRHFRGSCTYNIKAVFPYSDKNIPLAIFNIPAPTDFPDSENSPWS